MLTPGQAHDLACAELLIANVEPGALLGDKAYDADPLIGTLTQRGITPVIPPKANRKNPRVCDFVLCCERSLVERFFNKIKHFRAIATRYDKLAKIFLAGVQLASAMILLNCRQPLTRGMILRSIHATDIQRFGNPAYISPTPISMKLRAIRYLTIPFRWAFRPMVGPRDSGAIGEVMGLPIFGDLADSLRRRGQRRAGIARQRLVVMPGRPHILGRVAADPQPELEQRRQQAEGQTISWHI